jgi:UDP-glucose 4-epimerase
MKILVTGGAGYIGSVTVERLLAKGEQVVVLDDLARGHRSAIDPEVPFYHGRIGDRKLIGRIAEDHEIEACIHFAALAYVGESVAQPAKYFENNVEQGVALMGSLLQANVRRVVFSSTCATYGEPKQMPISETCPQWPLNPYGWSKFTMERLLEGYDHAYGLKFVALRYFNAASTTIRNPTLCRTCWQPPQAYNRKWPCLAKTTRHPMEPAFATTFMWPIWRMRIFSPSSICARDANRILSI